MRKVIGLLVVVAAVLASQTDAIGGQKAKDGDKYKDIVYEPGYEHDKWGTSPTDHVFDFRAYTTSFDGEDDNDGAEAGDKWRVPEWVAFEVRKKTSKVKAERPSPWLSEDTLNADEKQVAP